jgi:hypothetical protein
MDTTPLGNAAGGPDTAAFAAPARFADPHPQPDRALAS